MDVIFGLDLDDYTSPRPMTTAGQLVTGPRGLLDLLETRLGLRGRYPHDSLRIIEYLGCLRQCDNGKRFYSRSLAVDELAVAETLLGWRDHLIEAGWKGTAAVGSGTRPGDLAAVEQETRKQLSPGIADRLRRIPLHLSKIDCLDITLTLIDDPADFSSTWQDIIGQLPVTSLHTPFLADDLPDQDGDLALLQKALRDNRPCRLKGDGTVQLISANNLTTLAHGLAALLADEGLRAGTTLVRGNRSSVLDLAFSGRNVPITDGSPPSAWRPHLQILPLALSLIWHPLDPYRLLEFLVNPVSPLPRFCRQRLAKVVAEYPGIGGDRWQMAIEEIKQQAIARADGVSEESKRIEKLLGQWLHTAAYDPEQGAPTDVLAATCTMIAQWAVARGVALEPAEPTEAALYSAVSAQARLAAQLLRQLASSGSGLISRLQLNRLVDQVSAEGIRRTDQYPECGHVHVARAPGACRERNATVCWYPFTAPPTPARWPWNTRELKELADHGAILPPTERILQQEAAKWLLPIQAATRRLLLLFARTSNGEATVIHPLWQRIKVLTENSVPRTDLDAEMVSGNSTQLPDICFEPVAPLPLIRPKRWWRIDTPSLLPPREEESFTSLKAFLESPYQWVFRHHARIRPGSLAEVTGGSRQSGDLLHRLLERLFRPAGLDWQQASAHALKAWIENAFTDLLQTEGANLLLPGQSLERENLRDVALRSCAALIDQLRAAGVVSVCMEKQVQGRFLDGRLTGYIDMLVTNRAGREALIDLKFGGGKYRVAELKENRHLQLAIYSQLRHEETKKHPESAYYIFREKRLLAQDQRFFPHADVVTPHDEQGVAGIWTAFERTWLWRREQMDQGLIEMTVTGTESDEQSLPPEDGLVIDEYNDRFNDYANLTGWPEDA